MAELKKIQASTLIESIVAMVIISITMGITFLILTNIVAKNNPQLRFKAYIEAQQAINIKLSGDIIMDDTWQKDGIYVEKRYLEYGNYESLNVLEIKVFNNAGKLLVLRRKIIRIP